MLVGPFRPALAGSELEKLRGRLADGLPAVDLAEQAAALADLRAAVRAGGLATVHDVSEGGLACTLAECCVIGRLGARVDLSALEADPQTTLFGEGPGGAIVAGPLDVVARVPGALRIGTVGGDHLQIAGLLDMTVESLAEPYEGAIPAALA
jgi:phosphoribosylformylglycinamidine synthase